MTPPPSPIHMRPQFSKISGTPLPLNADADVSFFVLEPPPCSLTDSKGTLSADGWCLAKQDKSIEKLKMYGNKCIVHCHISSQYSSKFAIYKFIKQKLSQNLCHHCPVRRYAERILGWSSLSINHPNQAKNARTNKKQCRTKKETIHTSTDKTNQ